MSADRLSIDCRIEVHKRGRVGTVVPWLFGAVSLAYVAVALWSRPPWLIFIGAGGVALTAVLARMIRGGAAWRGTVRWHDERLVILCGPVRTEVPVTSIEEWVWVSAPYQALALRTAEGLVILLHINRDEARLLARALDDANAAGCKRCLLSAPIIPVSLKVFRPLFWAGLVVIGGAIAVGSVIWPGSYHQLGGGAALVLLFAFSLTLGREARLIVGWDGIAMEGPAYRSYVPYAELRSVHATVTGAALRLRSVEQDYLVPISPGLPGLLARLTGDVFSRTEVLQARREAIAHSINDALSAYRRLADPPDPAPPPSFTTKRTTGVSPYRIHPTLRPALVEVLCSPRSRTGARLGAALSLSPLNPSEVPVVLSASRGFANTALRAAIVKAVSGAPTRKDMAKALQPEKWLAALRAQGRRA